MIRAALWVCACALLSGCFVVDELDAGQKILEENSPKKPAAPASAEAAPAAQGGQGWWANAKSLSGRPAGEGESQVVSCSVGKAIKFMRKGDCLSQGGRPKS